MDGTTGGGADGSPSLPSGLDGSPVPTGFVGPDGSWGARNAALAAALGEPPATLATLLVDPAPGLPALLARGMPSTFPVRLPDGRPADAVATPAGPDARGHHLVQLLDRSGTEALSRRLADAVEATERFVSRVSHDLKNPIGTAQGYAELLLEDPALPEEARGFARRVLSSSERAIATLTEIVTDARSASRVVPPDETDVTVLLAEVVAELAPLLEERGAVVTSTSALPLVRTDARTLSRALEAVIRNAVEHHPAGARVEVSARATASGWELLIDDDGPGIPADHRGAVLGGPGIGLPMARSALARCGAGVRLEASDAGGLRVVITVPQRRARDPELPPV
ncbi:MAG: HAMP domain-containing histidine kinase [Actinobacteria bacterium]|nr:HAMP domain-containing histidine kinase [Actinomycetota bacterium]